MSAFNHTPEPWHLARYAHKENHSVVVVVKSGEDTDVASLFNPYPHASNDQSVPMGERKFANAERIVSCVNGCKGIVDPETTVPELVAAIRDIKAACPRYSEDEGINAGLLRIMQIVTHALAKLEGGAE